MSAEQPLTLPPALAQAVEQYRIAEGLSSRAEAVQRLIEIGLAHSEMIPIMRGQPCR
ncbi:MAG: hypothetical protein KGL39_54730 [Patescibacteria group bacterium]|nr:hypothetical protein [Patescibacteria group bacterium]